MTSEKSTDTHTYVYFGFSGDDFDPNEISRELNIRPSRAWKKGEQGKVGKPKTYSHWQLATEVGKEYLDVPKLIAEIVGQLMAKAQQITALKERLHLTTRLQIVLDVAMDEELSTPILYLDNHVIKFLYDTGSDVDIDIYRC